MNQQRLRDERSRHAVATAVGLAREHGLRVEEPTVLADLFSVMVHLRPAPVVARVPTWVSRLRAPVEDWLAREIAVTTFLSKQGAPVVTPSRELPPGPHASDGFAVSFWTYIQPDPDRTPTAADCSAMLVELHGDAHVGNLIATRDGLVWIDFEDVCRGPVEWDLATTMLMDADAVAAPSARS